MTSMEKNAIEIRNISKSYDVYDTPLSRIRHAIWPRLKHGVKQVHALENVAFDVVKGEAVGIIGRNGSGKSTLLEIITGTLEPTAGSIQVDGRIAGLLELGSGFNPEYSGRENVFLNGLLMGLDKASIEDRFDDIVGFADVGDVLDRPVKTYSSGMLVRLAFSVQVALQPDILIVDEALSVGDYFFQQKCFERLKRMRDNGLTLLFVSHDMASVRDLCDKAIYLKSGRLEYIGDSKTAIQRYLNEQASNSLKNKNIIGRSDLPTAFESVRKGNNLDVEDIDKFKSQAHWKSNDIQKIVQAVRLLDQTGEPLNAVRIGEEIKVQVLLSCINYQAGHVGLAIKNRFGSIVTNIGSYTLGLEEIRNEKNSYQIFEVSVVMMLEAGDYSIRASFGEISEPNVGQPIDPGEWFGPLRVVWNYQIDRAPFLGMFGLPAKGRILPIAGEFAIE